MDEQIQKNILKKFMYNPKLRYNEIWDKELSSSSKFDYYLKKLISANLIKKNGDFYEISAEGFSYIASLDGVSIQEKKRPLVCSFVLPCKEGKVLLVRRKKQPFFDYLNIPGGKVEFGAFSSEEGSRELLEETGLTGQTKLKAIEEKVTVDADTGEVLHHMIGFFYIAENVNGELLEKTREGENVWFDIDKLYNLKEKTYPDHKFLLQQLLSEEELGYFTVKRYMRGDTFVNIEVSKKN